VLRALFLVLSVFEGLESSFPVMKLPFKGAHGAPEGVPAPDSADGGAVQARGAYEVDGESAS
jgi:hypothetical protein